MTHRSPTVLTAVLAAALTIAPVAALTSTAPAAADEPLLSVDAAPLVVPVPAPGHSADWSLRATNVSSHPVAVSAVVSGVSGGVLAGAHPLQLAVDAPDGTPLAVPSAGSTAAATSIGTVAPGATIEVRGHSTLPRDAGDEYQGLGGRLTVRLIGQDLGGTATPASPGEGALAHTGLTVAAVAVAAAALLGAGLLLLLARRRRRSRDGDDALQASSLSLIDPQVNP